MQSNFKMHCLLLGVACMAISVPARAQSVADGSAKAGSETGIQEIIVTAEKRAAKALNVPIALQVVSGDALKSRGFSNLQDLTSIVPSFRADNPGNTASTTFSIRGVGQRDVNPAGEENVAVMVDGAYVSFIDSVGQPLFDVERVEVLKGPQGTLFGRNATGGLVSIIHKGPTDHLDGYATVEGSSYNGWRLEGAVGGPISDTVSARISAQWDKADGYLQNLTGPALLAKKNTSVRAEVKYKPNADFELSVSGHYWRAARVPGVGLVNSAYVTDSSGNIVSPTSAAQYAAYCASLGLGTPPAGAWQGGSCVAAQAGKYTGSYGTSSFYDSTYYGLSATAKWAISDTVNFTSVTDYQHAEMNYSANITGTTTPLFQYDIATHPQRQFSQELRLDGKVGRLSWVTGLYYLNIYHSVTTDVNLTGLGSADFRADYSQLSKSYAAFAQGDYKLTDELTFTLGGRVMYDEKKIHNVSSGPAAPLVFSEGLDASNDKTNWSGKAVLSYKPSRDVTLYASINRGVKGGGYNSGGVQAYTQSAAYYKPETLVSYEAGAKASLLGRHLTLDGSVFHYDYTNYQAFAAPIGGSLMTINVDARINGAELFATVAPVKGLTLSGGVTYLDAKELNVPYGTGTAQFPMPAAPKWNLTGEVRYAIPVLGDDELAAQLNAIYVAKRSIAAVDYPAQDLPAYHRFDVRVTYTLPGGKVAVSGFIQNLTNEYILQNRVDFTTLSGNSVDTPERPRWGGISLTYKL